MTTLTDRQREVYQWIRQHIETHGYSPSVRDIQDGLQIASPNGVMCHLHALRAKGLIDWQTGKARTIRLVKREKKIQREHKKLVGGVAEFLTRATGGVHKRN